MKTRTQLVAVLLVSICCIGPLRTHAAEANEGPLLFENGLEAGDLSGWGVERGADHAVNVVKKPVRAGKFAARFEVRKDDPIVANGKRAELKVRPEEDVKVERWYGFSIFLPDGYAVDPEPEIVTQWHAVPDLDQGEVWRSPPLALSTRAGHWNVGWRWDADRIMKANRADGSEGRDLGPYPTGEWTDWVFHVKWSWEDDGRLQVWRNGRKEIDYRGPIGYNDATGVYLKTGIYKWVWKRESQSTTTRRVIFVDEVRIGNAKATYEDVAPRGKR